jgi:hypothetical protein
MERNGQGSCRVDSSGPATGLRESSPVPSSTIMSETLVVIRTFGSLLDADEAQIELLNAGIYSLLLSDESIQFQPAPPNPEIALAVHRRDADVASAVLTPLADTG